MPDFRVTRRSGHSFRSADHSRRTPAGLLMRGHARLNEWRADGMQGADLYRRAMRAHANCVENLPVYAGIVVCATAAQATDPLLDVLALTLIAARLCQTTTHVALNRPTATPMP